MKEEFDIQMSVKVLYSYLVYHAYRGMAGILGTCVGLIFIMVYTTDRDNAMLLIAGLILILYLPLTLRTQAARQYLATEAWKKPLHYCMDDEGITISQEDEETKIGWEGITKAVSSPSAIILYTGKNNASILPKKQLGERLSAVVQIISTHVDPKKVKIRGNLSY